jgi:hypothetical protein
MFGASGPRPISFCHICEVSGTSKDYDPVSTTPISRNKADGYEIIGAYWGFQQVIKPEISTI